MNAREKRIVGGGGMLVLAAVLWHGGLGEAAQSWGEARQRLVDESARVEDLTRRASQRDAVAGRLRQRLGPAAGAPWSEVVEAQAAFPGQVRAALGGAGLEISAVSVQGVQRVREVPGASLVRVRVEGTVEGRALPAVLAATRSLPRVTLVEEVELARVEQKWSVGMVLATPATREDEATPEARPGRSREAS